MEVMVFIILLGIVLIDGKLWKVVWEQRRHNKAVEQLLAEIRARVTGQPMFGIWRTLRDNPAAGDWWRGAGEDSPAAQFLSLKEAELKAEELNRVFGYNAAFEVRPLTG